MKGGIPNCPGEQTSIVTSTSKKRAEPRDFTDKSEGRRDSARASTLLLRRGVWRFFRYFGSTRCSRRSIVHLYTSLSAEKYRCDRTGHRIGGSRQSRDTSLRPGLNRTRFFSFHKNTFLFQEFHAFFARKTHSWLTLVTDRSNFICDFCCRTRWSRSQWYIAVNR